MTATIGNYVLHLKTTKGFLRGLDAVNSYCDVPVGAGMTATERREAGWLNPQLTTPFTLVYADPARRLLKVRLNRKYGDHDWLVNDLCYAPRYIQVATLEHEGALEGCECTPCMEGGLDVMFNLGLAGAAK